MPANTVTDTFHYRTALNVGAQYHWTAQRLLDKWFVEVQPKAGGFPEQLMTARGKQREFKSLDAVAAALDDIGVKHFTVAIK